MISVVHLTGELLYFYPLYTWQVGYLIFTCQHFIYEFCCTPDRWVILFLPVDTLYMSSVVHLTGGLSYFYLQYTWGRWVGGSRCRPDTRTPPRVGTRTWIPWGRKLNTAWWWVCSGTWLFRWLDWPASDIYRQLRKSRREKNYISTELYYISCIFQFFQLFTISRLYHNHRIKTITLVDLVTYINRCTCWCNNE